MSHRTIVVYHRETGDIRQVVKCLAADAEKQHHAFDNHHYLDVTESEPNAHPKLHSVNHDAGVLVPRRVPLWDRRRQALARALEAHDAARRTLPDLAELTAAATLGGPREREELRVALAAHRAEKKKLSDLTQQIESSDKPEAIDLS